MSGKQHTYAYAVDTESESAPAHVVRMVGHDKRVLEVGCGPGSITRVLSQQGHCQVTGLELDAEAIDLAAPYCTALFQADLNSADWPALLDGADKFDVVVAADVLEHLYDPWETLSRMATLINADGYLVISLPHAGHAAVMACLHHGDFEYRDWGLLDRTHIRFFCFRNIEALFAQAQLKIIEVKYVCVAAEDTELAAAWSALPAPVQDVLMGGQYSEVYQVVIKAIPMDRPGTALSLIPPAKRYQRTPADSGILWKRRIGTYMSPEVKAAVRKGLKRLGITL
ncbi:MAG: hypothetical protein COW18_00050 [Zetaproteobacteria bacterium CG12_big_fil_rev_8_21_14_0_65_54_13]|nr:MAG: hypothetical protein COX55_07100 [Zetaproteobacteria bacterium CG23_combo_of_CG06-09_8_20_14_all_54_7]PIW51597.1 MAG: hypothetical protein COW18_00050 [Zetaproteobacteria bacterium CG12_big_fil_rev_8_21_14_0_65_54_13]PIX55444.1 MAG: hypothetical protein COZ50_02770 [Zetaproteobacteria bacterium CG_4_10_14_3_um_filter_54_28]PJA28413.1 MAG: hypothetical protein CO188_09505 [Zetaproteobacteria bacterium CG_4_9_14_3_um_filter_54_145]